MEHPYLPVFFGSQADYYTEVAEDIQAGKTRFNPAAFLCGVLWMGYRKMYWQAFVVLAIILAESMAEEIFFPGMSDNRGFSIATNVACNTIIGFIGNRLYVNFAARQIEKVLVNTAGKSEESRLALIHKKGGVAWYGPILVLLMILGIGVVILLVAAGLGIEID